MCVRIYHICAGTWGGQKRASDTRELQAVVNHRELNWGPLKRSKYSLTLIPLFNLLSHVILKAGICSISLTSVLKPVQKSPLNVMLFIVETYFSPEMKTFLNVLETLSFTVSSRMIKNQCHVVATLGLLLGSRQCFLSLRLVSTHG